MFFERTETSIQVLAGAGGEVVVSCKLTNGILSVVRYEADLTTFRLKKIWSALAPASPLLQR